jgi:ADP-ribosylglycohydrolase
MLGAIAGDVIGSAYEWNRTKREDFALFTPESGFTDDTAMTVAVADALLWACAPGGPGVSALGGAYVAKFREYGRKYPDAGYGGMFSRWLASENPRPYRSFGNGSAMRASPVGFAFGSLGEVLREAKRSAAVTHNHPEGIKGARAAAAAVFIARTGGSKTDIRKYAESQFHYDLGRRLDDIRPAYAFDETCQRTVPEAIIAFLESEDFEDAVRKAVSLGGDSDTLACITGGIAQAYYGKIPKGIYDGVWRRLDAGIKKVIKEFNARYEIRFETV